METEILIEFLTHDGFALIAKDSYEQQLTLAPDLLYEKDSTIRAIVFRESPDNLPSAIILRFSQSKRISTKTLEIYFYFPEKPSMTIMKNCKALSVGIYYCNKHSIIETYAESKLIKGRRNIIKAIPTKKIFFSSRQELTERNEGKEIIDVQRESLKVPIFALLVEDDQHYSANINNLWPIIERCMDDCEYVLVILTGEHRDMIDQETRRAIEYFDTENILFYVKNDKEAKEQWKDLLLHASHNGIKYIEYFDLKDFKLKFYVRLMKIIKVLHETYDVPFLSGDL
ncbi:MAG: hypothetical protein ABI261_08260 [Ginsengibacter sp.]